MVEIHPFYEAHRGAMEAAMRQRLDLAETMVRERARVEDVDKVRQEVMGEFEVVLTQMPYVGGAASRMSDFFMRLIGFMAIGRVLRRHGVALPVIGDIERESYKAQLLAVPAVERIASGRQFMSLENQLLLREQAAKSLANEYPDDFVYDFVQPGPGDTFEFGIDYKACGFCKFAGRHGDQEILPHICGLDFEAYAARGIRLERTQTLAGGASHCNFRFSRLEPLITIEQSANGSEAHLMPKPDAELQLDQFIEKFSKDMGKLIRAARAKMRALMPQAFELVYDNYNFFVIGYGPSEKAGDAIFSLAAQAKGLSLCFLQGAKLPDPHKLLRGTGTVVRNIRLTSADTLDDPKVFQLIDVALKCAKSPIPADGSHRLIVKSVSAKQRPRQAPAKKAKAS